MIRMAEGSQSTAKGGIWVWGDVRDVVVFGFQGAWQG